LVKKYRKPAKKHIVGLPEVVSFVNAKKKGRNILVSIKTPFISKIEKSFFFITVDIYKLLKYYMY